MISFGSRGVVSLVAVVLWCVVSYVVAWEQSGGRDRVLRDVEARVVSLSAGNPGSADVQLQWAAVKKGLYDASHGREDPVVAYEVQSTVSGADAWASLSTSVTGMASSPSAGPRRDRHEKQRIFTRVDSGQIISDGFFRLAFAHAGTSPLDMHQHTVTPPIAFDASESDLKRALETLDVVSNVQVFRRVLDATAKTFEWIVLFDPLTLDSRADHGDLPLVTLYSETISAAYSGPGDQVAIQSMREGVVDGLVCIDDCSFTATDVRAGQTLAFRVRPRFAVRGWGAWSRTSEPLVVPATPLPRAPPSPELVSATTSQLTIKWARSIDDQNALFPVTSYHLQQQCDRDLSWRTVNTAIPPGRTAITTSVSTPNRSPNTSCAFRVAATNANGAGSFGPASARFRTLAAPPSSPTKLLVFREPSLVLSWGQPTNDGGSQILGFDLELRTFSSTTWVRVPDAALDGATQSCDLVASMSLVSYTRYAARIRARNSVGASAFVAFPDFLTDYVVEPQSNGTTPTTPTGTTTVISFPAFHDRAANMGDLQYVHGIANGGQARGEDGEPGVVLVFPITFDGDRLDERLFYFARGVQSLQIPRDEAPRRQIVALDVYAWGGGGGSGDKTFWGTGGGGAFARGVVRIAANDNVQILVGGGGQGASSGGRGGWNGGGDGGAGGFGGGGGGGASELWINGQSAVIAAGGGGGGSSDYCCAHGGGGGTMTAAGEDGLFPDATSIPLDSRITGISRDEYHSVNVEGDLRDFVGLPARHNHLDYGFAAASADYTTLATGGGGASATQGGSAGQAASYVVSRFGKCFVNAASGSLFVGASLAASQATPGRRGRGGKGEDGKDCGGGGGGGYFGGGGGGAGIDGAGGGGGSSFVATDLLFARASTTRAPQETVANVTAWAPTSTSITLSWQAPPLGFVYPVQGFVVEMANRSANEDFRVKRLLPATVTSITLDSLTPMWWYRFRVKPLFRDAARGTYSEIKTMQTPPPPVNTWQRVQGVRSADDRTIHAGSRSVDARPARRLPSARRGHSLTAFNDGYLYLFGGFSGGYACNQAHKDACVVNTGVNNELWRFDPLIRGWRELVTVGGPPPAREKHTMAVVSSHLLVFGGRQNGIDDNVASLNDLWSLKISSTTRTTSATLQNRESNLAIRDGGERFTIANVGHPPDLCVADMVVSVDLTHACAQTLRIEVLGPGPLTHPQRQPSATFPFDSQTVETTWSDPTGFGVGQQRTTPTVPSARSFPVTLQRPEMASSGSACLSGRRSLVFSSASSLEALAVFRQQSAAGGWTLSVLDTALDGNTGVLNSWDISFTLTPCVPTWTWNNVGAVATGTPPSARFQHSTIVYQSSMFVYGGRHAKPLTDLYRFDFNAAGNTGVWTALLPVTSARDKSFYHGRIVLITPYQLLAIGQGLRSRATTSEPHTLSRALYVARKSLTESLASWQLVAVENTDEAATPLARYFAAAAFIDDPTPRVYLYGGQDDTSLLSDWWTLRLDALVESEPTEALATTRQEICAWRLTNAVLQQSWANSCGVSAASVAASSASECSLDTLLLYAWCSKTYQSVVL